MAILSMQQGFPVCFMFAERDCRAALAMTKATLERPWFLERTRYVAWKRQNQDYQDLGIFRIGTVP